MGALDVSGEFKGVGRGKKRLRKWRLCGVGARR